MSFLSMGGYAAFVWPAYGAALLILGALPMLARRAERRVIDAIRSKHASTS